MKQILAFLFTLWISIAQSWAVITVDTSVHSNGVASAIQFTITTGASNELIVVICSSVFDGFVGSPPISDNHSLTWAQRSELYSSGDFGAFYATAATAQSYTISVNTGGTSGAWACDAIALAGANNASPFDANASVPNINNGTSPMSVSTTTANDIIIVSAHATAASAFPDTSFTASSGSGANNLFTEYQIISGTVSGLSVQNYTGSASIEYADAIVPSGGGAAVVPMRALIGAGN